MVTFPHFALAAAALLAYVNAVAGVIVNVVPAAFHAKETSAAGKSLD